jgi:hypothetical protein
MILFTPSTARTFRTLLARCVTGRPRGPAPPVVVRFVGGTRTLAATTPGGVILTHTARTAADRDDLVVLPGHVLAGTEGGSDEPVTLDRGAKLRGVVRWSAGGTPRSHPVELILPGKQHELPPPPALTPVPATFLAALHECGRTAARESGRFALSKVQVQGNAGRAVATDGKVALLWSGFRFPFADPVLVPAVPVFGAKPLCRMTEVRVGRTDAHLVVAAGPWAVWLPTDTKAKFPDVAGVVPRHAPTVVTIGEPDAAEVVRELPGLPGHEHELRPVTLDAGATVRVRGRAGDEVRELVLGHSVIGGPALQVVLDRRVLARVLALGCRTWKLAAGRPVVAEGGPVTLVTVPLDPALSATPATDTPADPTPEPIQTTPHEPERTGPMKPEPNGHPTRDDPPDVLALAEAVRDLLAEAASKAGRLVAALRHTRKEKKALASVLSGLRHLNLGHGGPR